MRSSYISKKNRDFIRKLAYGCCDPDSYRDCQCQEAFSMQSFSMEHIIPIHLNGSNEINNLALSCQGCNNHKFTKIGVLDEKNDVFTPFFHPRQDVWTDHFTWNENYTLIIPLTEVGKVTLEALKMNKPQIVNWRTAVFAIGKHPPVHTLIG